jgi:hypothetical protein
MCDVYVISGCEESTTFKFEYKNIYHCDIFFTQREITPPVFSGWFQIFIDEMYRNEDFRKKYFKQNM